jgi:hypothetical protein
VEHPGDGTAPRPASGTYSTSFALQVLADDLTGDLADQEVVGCDLAADHASPRAPAGVDRDHAGVALTGVCR